MSGDLFAQDRIFSSETLDTWRYRHDTVTYVINLCSFMLIRGRPMVTHHVFVFAAGIPPRAVGGGPARARPEFRRELRHGQLLQDPREGLSRRRQPAWRARPTAPSSTHCRGTASTTTPTTPSTASSSSSTTATANGPRSGAAYEEPKMIVERQVDVSG